jgi:hypothetical protein
VSRERLSPQQWARLEAELRKGPLAHGFANDQRWTLGRIKTLIGKLFHVGYTIEGTSKLMRRHGWSAQVPVRQVLERDEDAVAVWKAEVWPEIKARRATWAPSSPYALVSFSSVMIPVSRSAARCARYPSRRSSRDLRVCRASGSTVEITLSSVTFCAIRHRPSRPSLPPAGSTSCPATRASSATAEAADSSSSGSAVCPARRP